MNISIENKILIQAVHTAARFAERRGGTLPALASLLIIAGDDGIKIRATNLEAGVDLKITGTIHATGAAAVPAALISQIVSSLPQEGVSVLEQQGDILSLTTTTGHLSLKTTPYEDFPVIPFPENPKNRFILPSEVFRNALVPIANCASSSTVRPELSSILFSLENSTVTLVATDSFRLAEKKLPFSGKGENGSFLLPAKNALEIAQALPVEDVIISFDEHQCAIIGNSIMLVSRLTNATYPDYKQIIPKESVVEAVVLRKDFENALKRTSIFSDAFQKIKLSFDEKKKQVACTSRNPDLGESLETIPAKISGGDIQLSFNHRYLSTILSLTQTENISLTAAGVGRPLLIRGVGDASLLYLVSPMNQ